ncbi:hypothetical protein JCM21900_004583 [Sporobolomyces salmonicolor]
MSRLPMGMLFPEQTTSGISRTADGDRVVAASRRPDGTFRKPLKIRPGFTPQEDVSLFRPQRQLEADAHRAAKGAVPGLKPHPMLQAALSGIAAGQSKAQRKNAKRKEKRDEDTGAATAQGKGMQDDDDEEVPQAWDADEAEEAAPLADAAASPEAPAARSPSSSSSAPAPSAPSPARAADSPSEEATAKRIRALRKKLKQSQQLNARQAAGLDLPPAEKDKVDKMRELEDELAKLTLTLTAEAGSA